MVTVIDEAFVFFQLQKADKHQGEKLQIILFSLILSVSFKVCFIFFAIHFYSPVTRKRRIVIHTSIGRIQTRSGVVFVSEFFV